MDSRNGQPPMLRVDASELSPYAQCVNETDLRVGGVYFTVSYVDDEMFIPVLKPVVFAGRDLQQGDEGILYFQDYESYKQGLRWLEPHASLSGMQATFLSFPSTESTDVYDFEGALESLLKCSIRRRAPAI